MAWTTGSWPKPGNAKNGLLEVKPKACTRAISFQDVKKAGQLRISLDMQQFSMPMTISLQSMGI